MDPTQFDTLSRLCGRAHSRRTALAVLLVALATAPASASRPGKSRRRRRGGATTGDSNAVDPEATNPEATGGSSNTVDPEAAKTGTTRRRSNKAGGRHRPRVVCLGDGRPCSGADCQTRCCGQTSLPAKPFGTSARVCWCKGMGEACEDRRECCAGDCSNGQCRGVIQSGRKCNAGDICTAGQDTCRAYTNLDSPDGRFCVRTDGDTCGSNQMCLSYRCAQRRCGLYDAGPQISVAAIWGGKGGGGNDGEPPQFTFAVDVHVDGQGNVFVPNAGGFPGNQHRVLELSPEGLRLAAWGEKGNGGADGSSPKFNQPYSVTTDSSGNIYVADRENHRVQKLDPQGIRLAAWGASGSGGSTGGSPQFDSPQGVAVDADGNVYIADTLNHRIQKLDPDGNVLAAWGNRGSGGSPGGAPKFDEPYSVALDSLGYVYVADFRNSRVQKLDVDGTVLAVWGSSGTGVVVGTAPKFRAPRDVVVDGDGNVYVADTGNHRIQKLDPDGMVLAAWGTRGGGGEVGGQPELDSPYGVAIDGAGSVYVADQGNDRIQKLDFLF